VAVRGGQRVQLTEFGPQAGVPGRCGAGQERLRRGAKAAEGFLRKGFRSDRPPWFGPGPAVVHVDH